MNKPPIITLQNLTVGYDRKTVLSNINLTLDPGKLICFMGPNGAGKSTLIKTMCQFRLPLSGNILLEGEALSNWSKQSLARKVSVVLTDQLNAGQLTGRELVAAGRYPYTGWSGRLDKKDWHVVNAAMEKTNTQSLSSTPFFEMSDGQRQKIMITRALCQETPLIILDEPTAHLDLNNRVAIVSLLRDLAHQENRGVLMATHELDLALQMADELWLAEQGESVVHGIPEDLVLDGSIDRVFQFKGYDLKTGSVKPLKSGRSVSLEGEGFLFLWTKNALERNGYEIVPNIDPAIHILTGNSETSWSLQGSLYKTVNQLLEALRSYFDANTD